jgi:hypothetical protein
VSEKKKKEKKKNEKGKKKLFSRMKVGFTYKAGSQNLSNEGYEGRK